MRLITQTRMYTSRIARRGAWLVVMLALVVVLALSACSRGGAGVGGSQGTGGSGGSGQVGGGTTTSVDSVTQTDSDLDAIVAALDSANLDASIDESGKDSPVQP